MNFLLFHTLSWKKNCINKTDSSDSDCDSCASLISDYILVLIYSLRTELDLNTKIRLTKLFSFLNNNSKLPTENNAITYMTQDVTEIIAKFCSISSDVVSFSSGDTKAHVHFSPIDGSCISPPNDRRPGSWIEMWLEAQRLYSVLTRLHFIVGICFAHPELSQLLLELILTMQNLSHRLHAQRSIQTCRQAIGRNLNPSISVSSLMAILDLWLPEVMLATRRNLEIDGNINRFHDLRTIVVCNDKSQHIRGTLMRSRLVWMLASVIRYHLRWLLDTPPAVLSTPSVTSKHSNNSNNNSHPDEANSHYRSSVWNTIELECDAEQLRLVFPLQKDKRLQQCVYAIDSSHSPSSGSNLSYLFAEALRYIYVVIEMTLSPQHSSPESNDNRSISINTVQTALTEGFSAQTSFDTLLLNTKQYEHRVDICQTFLAAEMARRFIWSLLISAPDIETESESSDGITAWDHMKQISCMLVELELNCDESHLQLLFGGFPALKTLVSLSFLSDSQVTQCHNEMSGFYSHWLDMLLLSYTAPAKSTVKTKTARGRKKGVASKSCELDESICYDMAGFDDMLSGRPILKFPLVSRKGGVQAVSIAPPAIQLCIGNNIAPLPIKDTLLTEDEIPVILEEFVEVVDNGDVSVSEIEMEVHQKASRRRRSVSASQVVKEVVVAKRKTKSVLAKASSSSSSSLEEEAVNSHSVEIGHSSEMTFSTPDDFNDWDTAAMFAYDPECAVPEHSDGQLLVEPMSGSSDCHDEIKIISPLKNNVAVESLSDLVELSADDMHNDSVMPSWEADEDMFSPAMWTYDPEESEEQSTAMLSVLPESGESGTQDQVLQKEVPLPASPVASIGRGRNRRASFQSASAVIRTAIGVRSSNRKLIASAVSKQNSDIESTIEICSDSVIETLAPDTAIGTDEVSASKVFSIFLPKDKDVIAASANEAKSKKTATVRGRRASIVMSRKKTVMTATTSVSNSADNIFGDETVEDSDEISPAMCLPEDAQMNNEQLPRDEVVLPVSPVAVRRNRRASFNCATALIKTAVGVRSSSRKRALESTQSVSNDDSDLLQADSVLCVNSEAICIDLQSKEELVNTVDKNKKITVRDRRASIALSRKRSVIDNVMEMACVYPAEPIPSEISCEIEDESGFSSSAMFTYDPETTEAQSCIPFELHKGVNINTEVKVLQDTVELPVSPVTSIGRSRNRRASFISATSQIRSHIVNSRSVGRKRALESAHPIADNLTNAEMESRLDDMSVPERTVSTSKKTVTRGRRASMAVSRLEIAVSDTVTSSSHITSGAFDEAVDDSDVFSSAMWTYDPEESEEQSTAKLSVLPESGESGTQDQVLQKEVPLPASPVASIGRGKNRRASFQSASAVIRTAIGVRSSNRKLVASAISKQNSDIESNLEICSDAIIETLDPDTAISTNEVSASKDVTGVNDSKSKKTAAVRGRRASIAATSRKMSTDTTLVGSVTALNPVLEVVQESDEFSSAMWTYDPQTWEEQPHVLTKLPNCGHGNTEAVEQTVSPVAIVGGSRNRRASFNSATSLIRSLAADGIGSRKRKLELGSSLLDDGNLETMAEVLVGNDSDITAATKVKKSTTRGRRSSMVSSRKIVVAKTSDAAMVEASSHSVSEGFEGVDDSDMFSSAMWTYDPEEESEEQSTVHSVLPESGESDTQDPVLHEVQLPVSPIACSRNRRASFHSATSLIKSIAIANTRRSSLVNRFDSDDALVPFTSMTEWSDSQQSEVPHVASALPSIVEDEATDTNSSLTVAHDHANNSIQQKRKRKVIQSATSLKHPVVLTVNKTAKLVRRMGKKTAVSSPPVSAVSAVPLNTLQQPVILQHETDLVVSTSTTDTDVIETVEKLYTSPVKVSPDDNKFAAKSKTSRRASVSATTTGRDMLSTSNAFEAATPTNENCQFHAEQKSVYIEAVSHDNKENTVINHVISVVPNSDADCKPSSESITSRAPLSCKKTPLDRRNSSEVISAPDFYYRDEDPAADDYCDAVMVWDGGGEEYY